MAQYGWAGCGRCCCRLSAATIKNCTSPLWQRSGNATVSRRTMQRSAGLVTVSLSLSLSLSLSVSLSHSLTQAASHLHIPALCHCRQGRRRGQAAANGRTDGLTAVSGRSETAACKTAVTDGDSTEEAADGRQNATEGRRETEGGPSSDKRCTAMAVGRSERLEAAVDGAVTSGE